MSPFDHPAFQAWFADLDPTDIICEPFAGARHIVDMVNALHPDTQWACFDIEPRHEAVVARDTLEAFPRGYRAVITNPPYLARNVATRRNLDATWDRRWDNLYKACLDTCLTNAEYVAAIVPESFVTAGALTDRIAAVVSLPGRNFDDTNYPVCLVLWGPESTTDYDLWVGDRYLGTCRQLEQLRPKPVDRVASGITFNDLDGQVGLVAVDAIAGASIRFCSAAEIAAEDCRADSRHMTRIAVRGLPADQVDAVIATANELLETYRAGTGDMFMTAFMSRRADGVYRRRLDYHQARALLAQAFDHHRLEVRTLDAGAPTAAITVEAVAGAVEQVHVDASPGEDAVTAAA